MLGFQMYRKASSRIVLAVFSQENRWMFFKPAACNFSLLALSRLSNCLTARRIFAGS